MKEKNFSGFTVNITDFSSDLNEETRPWGWFQTLHSEETYKVKRLFVRPYQRISLQYHNNREEYWTVVSGCGKVEIRNPLLSTTEISEAYVGKSFHVPKGHHHRLSGGKAGITIVEVQIGICSEDDIVRLEDDYKRV
jgi:mannose-6-phosphate isomerase-like protein (cupin superfamily)